MLFKALINFSRLCLKNQHNGNKLSSLALEPRIMLDGAALVEAFECSFLYDNNSAYNVSYKTNNSNFPIEDLVKSLATNQLQNDALEQNSSQKNKIIPNSDIKIDINKNFSSIQIGETQLLFSNNNNDYMKGGNSADVIKTIGGNNIIYGGGGNDKIFSSLGNDTIVGDEGNDYINAGNGNNLVKGGNGDDKIITGDGNDIIEGNKGNDIIKAGNGKNKVEALFGHNIIYSGTGSDTIFTGDGDDKIYSGDGNDIINSGKGNDTINSGKGADSVNLGDGNDVLNHIYDDDLALKQSNIYNGSGGKDTLIIHLSNENIDELAKYELELLKEHIDQKSSDFINFDTLKINIKNFEHIEIHINNIDKTEDFFKEESGNNNKTLQLATLAFTCSLLDFNKKDFTSTANSLTNQIHNHREDDRNKLIEHIQKLPTK